MRAGQKVSQLLIPQEEVQKAIKRLATEIRRDYKDKNPILVGVLKGSFVFLADLVRQLDIPLEVEFVQLSSYGETTISSGKIKWVKGTTFSVKGRDVLVIEDIVDSGWTSSFLLNYLKKKKPASLRLCTLLKKSGCQQVFVQVDYVGFEIPNQFVMGYGLDWKGQFRYLPDICFVETI